MLKISTFWKNRHSKAQIWTSEKYKCNNAHSGVFLRHSLQKREEVSRADWACSLNPPWRDRDYKKKWCGNISTVGRVETAAHGPMDLNIRVKARAGWHKYDAIWTGKKDSGEKDKIINNHKRYFLWSRSSLRVKMDVTIKPSWACLFLPHLLIFT